MARAISSMELRTPFLIPLIRSPCWYGRTSAKHYLSKKIVRRLLRRNLFGLSRDDLFHGAAPAVMRQIENDAIRSFVFDFIKGVWVVVRPPAEIGSARVDCLLGH